MSIADRTNKQKKKKNFYYPTYILYFNTQNYYISAWKHGSNVLYIS